MTSYSQFFKSLNFLLLFAFLLLSHTTHDTLQRMVVVCTSKKLCVCVRDHFTLMSSSSPLYSAMHHLLPCRDWSVMVHCAHESILLALLAPLSLSVSFNLSLMYIIPIASSTILCTSTACTLIGIQKSSFCFCSVKKETRGEVDGEGGGF